MIKRAVIATGGKQYLVKEGDVVDVELIKNEKNINFQPLLVIDGDKTAIGQPLVEGVEVLAEIIEPVIKADKVIAIRYKAKKRVKKVRGHRQKLTRIVIKKIS